MKVVYLSILTEIGNQVDNALRDGRTIDYIELTPREYREFRTSAFDTWGHHGVDTDGKTVLYCGVRIREVHS